MKHQVQPSNTSCGPTCVAILLDKSIEEVLALLPSVRVTDVRKKRKDHRSNVGEVKRLLAIYGYYLRKRVQGFPTTGTSLLRVHHYLGSSNWHFSIFHNGVVFDPSFETPFSAEDYQSQLEPFLTSFYPVYKLYESF